MKIIKFIVIFTLALPLNELQAQSKIVQITTIESTVAAGFGRSAMIITNEDGSQEETELNNLFSAFGINFANIKMNEKLISQAIKRFLDQGYKLIATSPLTLSAATGGNSTGMFMTRYTLTKD